jgi:hypothetical protein
LPRAIIGNIVLLKFLRDVVRRWSVCSSTTAEKKEIQSLADGRIHILFPCEITGEGEYQYQDEYEVEDSICP